MVQTGETLLALDTPYNGTFAGSGQPQLFAVDIPSAAPMIVRLTDPATADHVELYAEPWQTSDDERILALEPTARVRRRASWCRAPRPGTWYVLVYAESVAQAPGSFTLDSGMTPFW